MMKQQKEEAPQISHPHDGGDEHINAKDMAKIFVTNFSD